MSFGISYMGTKRQLAESVADVVNGLQSGPALDLFAGMCSVASAIGTRRNVWCNDSQLFASEVAAALFKSQDNPPKLAEVYGPIHDPYRRNLDALAKRFAKALTIERVAHGSPKLSSLRSSDDRMPNVARSRWFERERIKLAERPQTFPYRLFTLTYSGGYFGLRQCIEIDSLRYAFDHALDQGEITSDQHRWLLLALCRAMSLVSCTTGHFAQYLKPKRQTLDRIIRQRQRLVWRDWAAALESLVPIGTTRWRSRNKTFQADALELLNRLKHSADVPSVIYADPPYTSDQYSRYYHLYETLILFDYPRSDGVGRYRPDRFVSDFSLRSKALGKIDWLASACASMGSALVLSYPSNGLIPDSKNSLLSVLRSHFRRVETHELNHYHSSMGASKGVQKHRVTEIIYRAH